MIKVKLEEIIENIKGQEMQMDLVFIMGLAENDLWVHTVPHTVILGGSGYEKN